MDFRPPHEMHQRRFSRNVGLGLVLAAFAVLVFALSVVKITRGDPMKGYDHVPSAAHLPAKGGETPAEAEGQP
ncbi:hypothetical protein [Rhodobacter sp. SGA-6-6]|uniref:hypothetical protein n=1 Tax=Rhodobacter sp. SGA-6-6 TaxID=2710882 RepID=UPI001F110B80|nr:hypothetical protein [Rhodobacter sp. SGA-6-6]